MIIFLATVFALLIGCSLALGLCVLAVAEIGRRVAEVRMNYTKDFCNGNIDLVDRFCSHDFPIVEDVCANLKLMNDMDERTSMVEFRDSLRAKHGSQSHTRREVSA